MIRKYFKKLSVIFVGGVFILSSFAIFSSISTISISYAKEKTAAVGKDKIKAILLGQEKWIGQLDYSRGGSYLNEYVFEKRGKKMIVKIQSTSNKDHCKRKVKINSDGFRMSGCMLGLADMFYDPKDPIYPFKTKGDNLEYGFKA